MDPTSLVTVTFEGDARLTVLQVLSIDRLLAPDSYLSHVMVLNGEDNQRLRTFIEENVKGHISEETWARIQFVDADAILSGGPEFGWRTQQYLKLAVAKQVTTPYYLVLDGKNHFVRPSSLEEFFADDGRPRTVVAKPSAALERFARASLSALDCDEDPWLPRAMPTITPYLMRREDVLAMMDLVAQREQMSFAEAFAKPLSGATEFYLYYAYLVSSGQLNTYHAAAPLVTTLFTSWPSDPAVVASCIADAATCKKPMFGLHWRRLPQLTPDQTTRIVDMWRLHLLREGEEPTWFLAHEAPLT